MRFRYLSWSNKLLSSNKELEKVDQLTVHYAKGSIIVYANNELQMSLIDRIRHSSYLFVVINNVSRFTSVLFSQ